MEKTSSEKKSIALLLAVVAALSATGMGVLLLSILMYRFGLDEKKLSVGIIVIYVAATFLGGQIAGRKTKQKKYLWGLLSGVAYFCILFGISMIRKRTGAIPVGELITTACLCIGGGMLGGMLATVHSPNIP